MTYANNDNQRAALFRVIGNDPGRFENPNSVQGPIAQRVLADNLSPRIPYHDTPPTVIVDSGKYADAITDVINIPAGASVLAIPRPSYKRTMLLIQNNNATPVYFNLGKPANLTSFMIPAGGGTATFDAVVPQNEVYLFSTVGVSVPVLYLNADLFRG